jgi:glycosyltransferase involved in cell wall biosynthesis
VAALSRKRGVAPTWDLRIGRLLPFLRDEHGIDVDTFDLPAEGRAKRRLLRELRDYDVAWLHRHTMWPLELRLVQRAAKHLVFDYDDPVLYRARRPEKRSIARRLRFSATLRRCSAVLAASDRLVELAQPWCDNVVYSPLCLVPEGYSWRVRPRAADEPLRLVWLGSRSVTRYLEGARPALAAIGGACANVELTVVGHLDEFHAGDLPVTCHRWSPEVDARELERAHVGLVPMPDDPWAHGKAAMKPLQYLASGMPFVGSPVGVNLRMAGDGRRGLLASNPDDWVTAIQKLAADEPLRRRMAEEGIVYVREHHSPAVLAACAARVFRDVVGGR